MIQVTAELFFGYNPRDAILAQGLWLNNVIADGKILSKSTLQQRRICALMKAKDRTAFIEYMQKQLLRDLCLGFDCDLEWEGLPEDIRRCILDRALGVSTILTEDQTTFLTRRLHMSTGTDIETYLARCNYGALVTASALRYARLWVAAGEFNREHNLERTNSIVDLLSSSNVQAKPSLKDNVLLYAGNIYHGLGTMAKFFFVAFVADPEYQRELKWTISNTPRLLKATSRVILNGIWILSK